MLADSPQKQRDPRADFEFERKFMQRDARAQDVRAEGRPSAQQDNGEDQVQKVACAKEDKQDQVHQGKPTTQKGEQPKSILIPANSDDRAEERIRSPLEKGAIPIRGDEATDRSPFPAAMNFPSDLFYYS